MTTIKPAIENTGAFFGFSPCSICGTQTIEYYSRVGGKLEKQTFGNDIKCADCAIFKRRRKESGVNGQ